MHSFLATLQVAGKTAAGVTVPAEVVEALGGGRQPLVYVTLGGDYTYRSKMRATIGDHSYRSRISQRGGEFRLPISAKNRAGAGVLAGDEIYVTLSV